MKKFSNSKIQCYKNCRRLYELKYIHKMKFLGLTATLEKGKAYHSKIEDILLQRIEDYTEIDPKVIGMARAFKKYIFPKLPKVVETEKEFNLTIISDDNDYGELHEHVFTGFFDAITENGIVVEHKTTSEEINGVYLERLENDEQVKSYMLASGKNEILYTVIRKPTIRLCKNETEVAFAKRCEDWYDTDTDNKMVLHVIRHTQAEIDVFKEELANLMLEIENQKLFFKTPSYCTKYNRICDYYPICNNYNPSENYVMFCKKDEDEEEKKAKMFNFDLFN